MAVNKVEYFGKVLLDLTGDTVTAETLAEGVTAHDKSGAKITGTMTGGGGSGSVETCTLRTGPTHSHRHSIAIVEYVDGVISTRIVLLPGTPNTLVSDNVVVGSFLYTSEATPSGAISHIGVDGNRSVIYQINGDIEYTHNPCFARGTLILLADGTTKFVQDITYDDLLLVWDFDNGCYASSRPVWIKKAQTTDYYYLCKFADGRDLKLIGSGGKCHRVLDIEAGKFESATDCVGKRVMTEQGETVLLSCERVDEEVEFYNIITHTHINLFAEGVLTSCRLNNLYPIENMRFVKESRMKRTKGDYTDIVGSDTFRGLRLAEQTMDIAELNAYIERLYALKDWKPRYFVDDPAGTGKMVELTEAEYNAFRQFRSEVKAYAEQITNGEIALADVPETHREAVSVRLAPTVAE